MSPVPDFELVSTPDCTSIDTTIPTEEVQAFEDGLRRRKEIAELLEDIQEPQGEATDVEKPDAEEAKRNSDYVDEVFKPVFSIA